MMLACHAGDPGSIPGSCILLLGQEVMSALYLDNPPRSSD